jgi:hypothetical protein
MTGFSLRSPLAYLSWKFMVPDRQQRMLNRVADMQNAASRMMARQGFKPYVGDAHLFDGRRGFIKAGADGSNTYVTFLMRADGAHKSDYVVACHTRAMHKEAPLKAFSRGVRKQTVEDFFAGFKPEEPLFSPAVSGDRLAAGLG